MVDGGIGRFSRRSIVEGLLSIVEAQILYSGHVDSQYWNDILYSGIVKLQNPLQTKGQSVISELLSILIKEVSFEEVLLKNLENFQPDSRSARQVCLCFSRDCQCCPFASFVSFVRFGQSVLPGPLSELCP